MEGEFYIYSNLITNEITLRYDFDLMVLLDLSGLICSDEFMLFILFYLSAT